MKKRNIFWGLIFLLIAACILFEKLGYFPGINVFKLILSAGLLAILIESIPKLNFAGILFPLAFLAILFDEVLHIENLTPWPVLGIALFGSIGLSLIFPHKNKSSKTGLDNDYYSFSETTTQEYTNHIKGVVSFNSAVKYINSTNFEHGDFKSSFGSLKLYFDQAGLNNNTATLQVDISFGTITLYVPRDWNIQVNVKTSFGSVDEKGSRAFLENAPILYVNGNVSFGSLEIIYI